MKRRTGVAWWVVALVLAACAAPAQAGTFTVYSCKKPDGGAAPTEGWTVVGSASVAGCAGPGGAMRAEMPSGGPGAYADLVFTPPAATPVIGYVLYRAASASSGAVDTTGDGVADVTWQANYDVVENDVDNAENCRGTCIKGTSATPFSEGNAFTRSGIRATRLFIRASCDPGSGTACQAPGAVVDVHRAAMVLEDAADPVFTSPPAGTLVSSSQPLTGVASASFGAADEGSGVYRGVVEVDGVEVASEVIDPNDGRCAVPFVSLQPCKTNASGTLTLDTATLLDGAHTVRILVRDATGTNQIAYGPVPITTRNGTVERGAPNGTGAGDGARLTAAFKGRRKADVTVGFGKRVTVRGRLLSAAGAPISGARLEVAGRPLAAGARERVLRAVTTGVDGRYALRVTAKPGRRLQVRYRAFANDAGFAAAESLRLQARAGVRLRSSARAVARGQRFSFSGRLLGGPIPKRGVAVEVQGFQPGQGWIPVRTGVRTGRKGRFRVRYAFRSSGRAGTFRFRAVVRRAADYPYGLGTSRRVAVRVR